MSGGEAEAELYPPHSRFHPVPSAPVFAQRYDYTPPDRMMVPLPAHPRLAPHSLPHVPDIQPLPPGGGAGGPVPNPVPNPVPVPVEAPAEPFAEPAVEPPADNLLPQRLPDPPRE